jgi:hypothetical protein
MSTIASTPNVTLKPRRVGMIVAAGALVAIAAIVLVITLSGTSISHNAQQVSAPTASVTQYPDAPAPTTAAISHPTGHPIPYPDAPPPATAGGSDPTGNARAAFMQVEHPYGMLRAEHSYGMVP